MIPALILSAALVLTGGFRDGITCTIQGYVYVMPGGEHPDFRRADTCPGVYWRMDADHLALILWSPVTVVTVPLPASTAGQMLFQYRWGSELALIGGQPQRVHAAPMARG